MVTFALWYMSILVGCLLVIFGIQWLRFRKEKI